MGIFNNFIDDDSSSGSGKQGARGLPGRGINSITTIDNNDGSIQLTFNMSDNTTEQSSGTLVSDSLLNLNKLSLEGTNDVNKLLVKQENETVVMNANSVNGVVEIPNVKSSNLIVGNTNYILPATNLENGLLKSTIDGGNIQLTWATAPDDLQFGTGLRSGGVISINADPTKFNLQAGEGVIASDILTYFSWTTFTAQSIPNPIPLQPNGTPVSLITTRILTYISINSTGTLLFSSELPDAVSQRTYVYLGILVHTLTINPIPDYTINTINHQQVCIEHGVNQLHDLCAAIGFININGNGLGLGTGGGNKIAKEAGKIFAVNANTVNDHENPHIVSLPTVDTGLTGTFQYRNRNGTSSVLTLTDFLPNLFDNGGDYNGTTPALPSNKWGISYVFVFTSGAVKIQPPQFSYSSSTEALLNLDSENFIIEPSIAANGLLIGYIIAKQGSTLASAPAVFVKAKKFGSSGGGSSGTGIDLSSRLAIDGSNSMTGSLIVSSATNPAMDIKGSGTSVLTVSGGAVAKKVTVLGNLELKNENGSIIYLATDASAQKLITTNIEVISIEGNGSNLNFNYPDIQAGQSIVKLNTDTKPFYIQSPNTTLTAPVDIINNDTDRDQLFRFLGDSSSAQIIINRTNETLTIEPETISVVRPLLTNTILNLGSTEIQSNVPYGVEDIATNKTSKLAVDRLEFSDNIAQTTAVLKYESNVVFINKPYSIVATSGIALYVNDAGGNAKFLVDSENNTVSSFVKQRIRVNDTSAFQVQTTGGISGFSVDTVTPQVDIKYPTEIKTTSAVALDVQDALGVPNLTVNTVSGKTTVLDLDTSNVNTTGTNIIKADSLTALDVRTSGNVSKFSVSTLGAVSDITINGKINNAVEGDIYYAGASGLLSKLTKPPTNDCYKLVFEGGALQWEPQIYGEIQFDARVTNDGVGIRQALNFPVANTWYGIPYGENGSTNITSTPANYLEVSNYFDAGGAGVDHMGFRYINGPTFKALIRFHVIIELITNGITTAGLFVNNTLDEMSLTPGFSNGDDSVAYDMSIITELTANTTVQAKIRSEAVSGGASYPEAFSVTVTRVC